MKLRLQSRQRLWNIKKLHGRDALIFGKQRQLAEACVCKNCGLHFTGNYCPNCGQSSKTRRLSFMNMVDDTVGLVTNLEGGMPRTIVDLFWRPGEMIRDYIFGKRKGYMKPLPLLFGLGTFYYLLIFIFAKDQLYQGDGFEDNITLQEGAEHMRPLIEHFRDIMITLVNNPALMVLVFIVPLIPATSICFCRTKFGRATNFMEQVHVQLFIGCQLMVFTIANGLFRWIQTGQLEYGMSDFLPYVILLIWDYSQIYQIKKRHSLWMTHLCMLLALLFFVGFVVVVTGIVYNVTKDNFSFSDFANMFSTSNP